MKRLLSLILVLALLLPVLSLAEDDDLDIEEVIEDVVIDDEGNEVVVDELTGESFLISSMDQDEIENIAAEFEVDPSVDPDSLDLNPNLPDNVVNIMLLGVDVKGTGEKKFLKDQTDYAKRCDVVIILSINKDTGAIKLTSIARNTAVDIPGRTGVGMIANCFGNGVYENGKYKAWNETPSLAVRTVNRNFELNAQHYVAINFYGVASIIEYLGGVDIELTKVEAQAINAYLSKHKRAISRTYDDKNGNRAALKKQAGVQHLDGIQALMYARLRSIDSDFVRTARTRHLLDCLLQSVVARLKSGELDLLDLFSTALDYMITDMDFMEMLELASTVLSSGGGSGLLDMIGSSDSLIEEFRIPMDGTWVYSTTSGGSSITAFKDKQRNVEALHEFIYGSYYPAAQ